MTTNPDDLLLVRLALGLGPNGGTFDDEPLAHDDIVDRVRALPPRLVVLAVTLAQEQGFPAGLVHRLGRTYTR